MYYVFIDLIFRKIMWGFRPLRSIIYGYFWRLGLAPVVSRKRTKDGTQRRAWIQQAIDWCDTTLPAKFIEPTWGPSGAGRTQVGPMLAPWTLLFGNRLLLLQDPLRVHCIEYDHSFAFNRVTQEWHDIHGNLAEPYLKYMSHNFIRIRIQTLSLQS